MGKWRKEKLKNYKGMSGKRGVGFWSGKKRIYVDPEGRKKKISEGLKMAYNNGKRERIFSGKKEGFKKGNTPWNKGKEFLQIKGINNPNWKGGKSFEPYSVDWTSTLRKSIRERDHYICKLCGKQQEDVAHSVHHIDYNKENCDPKNLITLCKKCHIKTNNNRDYWINYFNK